MTSPYRTDISFGYHERRKSLTVQEILEAYTSSPPNMTSLQLRSLRIQAKLVLLYLLSSSTLFHLVLSQESSSSSGSINDNFDQDDHNDHDDRTLLDIFGESAKQYLTQKVIPPTDAECKWDWRTVRCEPYCECAFLPQWGDYHLGRSCRWTTNEDNCHGIPPNSWHLVLQKMVQSSRKMATTTEHVFKAGYRKIQTNVCEGMPEIQCMESGELPLIAWQERLFCHYKIPTCDVLLDPKEGEIARINISSNIANSEGELVELQDATLPVTTTILE